MGTVMSNFQTFLLHQSCGRVKKKNRLKVTQKSKQKPARSKSPVSRTSLCQVAQTHNIQGHNEKIQTYAGPHIAPSVPGSSTAHHSQELSELSRTLLQSVELRTRTRWPI